MNAFIQSCIDKRYAVMNCSTTKVPALSGWSKRPAEDFIESIEPTGSYVMRMGVQENGDYIIGLDFDIMEKSKKTGKYKTNVMTQRLLDEWKEINEDQHGLYISSTQNNMGNLVNIKNCPEIIGIIGDIGRAKFQNSKSKQTLEILCSSLCILPPTKTVCKVSNKPMINRTFCDESNPILLLEPNSAQHQFILNYCIEFKNRHCKQTRMRDLRSKAKKEVYTDVHADNYKIDSIDHGLELMSMLNDERYCYDSWWKIGVCCLNSFEREFAEELFVRWSEKDPHGNFDGDIPFDAWAENSYDGLTWGLVMKWIEYDSPSKFIPCIIQYKRHKSAEKYEEYKKYFESTYHYCKDPQVFFYKSLRGKYIQKTMKDVRELEAHNDEYFQEWCSDENRKMYEISDSVPVKHIKDPKVFNTFRGYDCWEWESDWYEKCRNIDDFDMAYSRKRTLDWWNEYMWNLCGKDQKTVDFVKCIMGNVIFNPTKPTKVMVLFQGIEGTGKSFLINILRRILGTLNIAESAKPQQELFGNFNEPLLTAQVVSIDENDPTVMESVLSSLKNKITNENFLVNCKNEKIFLRTNTLQWFAFMNDFCSFNITTTNRRFNLIKTSMDLAIKNERNSKFWTEGYEVILKNPLYLQIIASDIREVYESKDGYNMDFALSRPKTNYMESVVKNNIDPFYTYLQYMISNPLKLMKQYENAPYPKPKQFAKWYKKNFIWCKDDYLPLFNKGLKQLDAEGTGFWTIKMSSFREKLNEYTHKVLDKKNVCYSSDDILTKMVNFFEAKPELFLKSNNGGVYWYCFNPEKTKEQLIKYKYYRVENEDCEQTTEDGTIDMFAEDTDDEDDYEEPQPEPEYKNNIIQPEPPKPPISREEAKERYGNGDPEQIRYISHEEREKLFKEYGC